MALLIVPFLIALTFSRHLSKRLPASTRSVKWTIDKRIASKARRYLYGAIKEISQEESQNVCSTADLGFESGS